MLQNFKTHCPTNDETVSVTVNYIYSRSLEDVDKTPYTKGIIRSCTCTNSDECSSECYSKFPQTIYM